MFWRFVFLIVYLAFFLVRSRFGIKFQTVEKPEDHLKELNLAVHREGKISMTLRSILSLVMLLSIVIYVISPSWLQVFSLSLPLWLRLTGLALSLATLPLLYWTHRALGRQYSPDLDLKEGHKLITRGPYSIIRHPMYTILIVFMISISLFSASTLIFLPHMAALLLLLLRLGKEEAMLIEKFGADYQKYMLKTGRLLPKFN
ncbi:isoprenylcysteine carboxylmethyltransferase family protein [Desulfosporosinus sp. FKB]|uniref:methyltransferase family protein n=1 Tax=Desulfosporosinus sp. FKB TaxID=1969835 RepID=UPI000B49C4B0|nr:isoprenylcysteine carboxylmethyltransferase family protein [Desulfosporosinus sp. FKB]